MNFDYGDTLKQAAQITWRNKSFWVLMILRTLPSVLTLPIFFLIFSSLEKSRGRLTSVLMLVFMLVFILLMAASLFIMAFSSSAVTLGIIRTNRREGSTMFMELLRDVLPFYWRSLGLILSVQLTIGLVFTIIFLFIGAFSLVTMGIGAICAQPILLLLTPFTMLLLSFMEAAQTVLLEEDLGVVDALKTAARVVREHVWKYLIISLIVYFGITAFSSFISIPLALPAVMLTMSMQASGNVPSQMGLAIILSMMCFFFPVITAVSGVTQTFLKATLSLTYLRLSRLSSGAATPPEQADPTPA